MKNLFIISDEDLTDKTPIIIPWNNLPKQVLESLPESYFHNKLGMNNDEEFEEMTVVFAELKDKIENEFCKGTFEDTENNTLFLW